MCFCGFVAIFFVFIRFESSDENALRGGSKIDVD